MGDNRNEFLDKLANICEEYKATFGYSKDDDGVYICLDNKEIFCGFLTHEDTPALLRAAKI